MGRNRLVVGGLAIIATVILTGMLVASAGEPPKEAQYVGVKKCRLCHLKEHKSWKKTKHASNFEVLIGAERSNPDCVRCHTTGFGKPGGFVSEEKTPGMENVSCESCHGPGSEHVKAAKSAPDSGAWEKKINKTPQNACVQCHNPHVDQKAKAELLRQKG